MLASSAGENSQGYEFKESENAEIRKTAMWCGAWGIISLSLGSIALLSVIVPAISMHSNIIEQLYNFTALQILFILTGMAIIIVGSCFFIASKALTRVADTTGNDIFNLMSAMNKLKIAFLVLTVGFIAIFLGWAFAGPSGLK